MNYSIVFRESVALTALSLLLSLPTCPANAGAISGWDFDDGTLQGWTNVLTSSDSTGPQEYEVRSDPGSGSWRPLGANSLGTSSGNESKMAAVTPFGNRDRYQDGALLFRSPEFELATGKVTAHLLGANPKGSAVAPNTVAEVQVITESSSSTGYVGIALRRTTDNSYVLHKSRAGITDSSSKWHQVDFTEVEIANLLATDPAGTKYTLDLIDWAGGNSSGNSSSWSSVALDTVTIPVAENNSLVNGGGEFSVVTRYAADTAYSTLADADDLFALPSGDAAIASEHSGTAATIDIHDSGSTGHFANDDAFLGGGGNDIAIFVTGSIEVTSAGDITFGFFANDGGRLLIDGNLVAEDSVADRASDTFGTINLSAGFHSLEFIYFEDGGGNTVELFVATSNGTYTTLNDANFELLMAAVPEPATLSIAGLLACMAFIRFYKKK